MKIRDGHAAFPKAAGSTLEKGGWWYNTVQ